MQSKMREASTRCGTVVGVMIVLVSALLNKRHEQLGERTRPGRLMARYAEEEQGNACAAYITNCSGPLLTERCLGAGTMITMTHVKCKAKRMNRVCVMLGE